MFSFFQYDPISHDEGRNQSHQQERLDNILRNEHMLMLKYFISKTKRYLKKRINNYKFYWSAYYIIFSMSCGAIIAGIDHLSYLDGLFIAASAMTGSGLSTIAMYDLSRGTFAIMSILMMIGCAPFMILPPIRFRRQLFAKVKKEIEQQRQHGSIPLYHELTEQEQHVIKEYNQIYDALGILRVVGILYYIIVLVSGVFIINGALHLHPLPQELINRRMNYFDCAAFLAVSAFGNAGFTLTTDNLVQLDNNPFAYIWITFLILAGNTAFPIFLRIFINVLVYTASSWTWILYTIKYKVFWTPVATLTVAIQRQRSMNHMPIEGDATNKDTVGTEGIEMQAQGPSSNKDSAKKHPEGEEPPIPAAYLDDNQQTEEQSELGNTSASMHIDMPMSRQPSTSTHKDNEQPQPKRPSFTLLQEAYHEQLQQQPTYEAYRDEMVGLLQFILDNPRHVTTHLFSPIQTKVLAVMVLTLIITQYVFFLCSTLTRPSVTKHYTLTELAGLGYFQTLSTRSAGFNIMNLRSLNQGLLFVYGIMMYLSAFPFVTTLQSTTQGRVILIEEHGKDLDDLLPPDESSKPYDTNEEEEEQKHKTEQEQIKRHKRRASTIALESQGKENNHVLADGEKRDSLKTVTSTTQSDATTITMNNGAATSMTLISLPSTPNGTASILLTAANDQRVSAANLGNWSSADSSEKQPREFGIDELAEMELERERIVQEQQQQQQGIREQLYSNTQQKHPMIGESKAIDDVDDNSSVEVGHDDEHGELDESTRIYLSSRKPRRRRLSYTKGPGSVVIVDEKNVDVVEINKKFAKHFLFRHSFFLILAVLICAFSEDRILSDPTIDVNLWYIMFEIISAYGNVGLTFGMPGEDYSLVGGFTMLGKFVVICIMWLGKHRGLPSSNDDVIDFTFSKYKSACRSDTLLALPTTPINSNNVESTSNLRDYNDSYKQSHSKEAVSKKLA